MGGGKGHMSENKEKLEKEQVLKGGRLLEEEEMTEDKWHTKGQGSLPQKTKVKTLNSFCLLFPYYFFYSGQVI